jgi:alanine dehydrogenase
MTTPLVVGIPTEIKKEEGRVALTPDGVRELLHHGVEVLVQSGAGEESSIPDDDYRAAGAEIVAAAAEVWERAQLVCKVKEPLAEEFGFFRPGLVLFTYLHLAAYPKVGEALVEHGVTGIAYETVQARDGTLPLLAPMSEVAGRMSIQVGAHFLERHNGGRGVLLGGTPGVRPARVAVLGAGNVGWNAAWMAAGLMAEVDLLDKSAERLRYVDQIQMGRITTLTSNVGMVERVIAEADLVVGAVLVPGGRAPTVVTEDMVRSMKPGAVIVDIAIDQGGCVETSHETTHTDPVFERHGVLHYAVGNMPGAVPHTSTHALTNATLPYLAALASSGPAAATRHDEGLSLGVNTAGGAVVNAAVAEALGTKCVDVHRALAAVATS